MKYKNIDFAIEDVSVFIPAKELFKKTYKSLFEFNRYKNAYEKTYMFRCYKWRLIISINRLVELAEKGLYELDEEVRPTETDAKKIHTLKQ